MLGPEGRGHLLADPEPAGVQGPGETQYVLEAATDELFQVGDDLYQIDFEAGRLETQDQPPALSLAQDEALHEALAFTSPDRPEQRIPTEESPSGPFDFSKKQPRLELADASEKQREPTAEAQPLPQAFRYQPSGDYSAFLKDHRIDWNKIEPEKKPRPKPQPVVWDGRGIKFGRHFRNKSAYHYAKHQPVL